MAAEAKQKTEPKEKKEKKAKAPAEAPAAETPAATAPPAPPRQPADPRLRALKKLQGTLLPKGVLRDRYKALMQRWASANHGGVTVEELKALRDDWKRTRERE